MDEFDLLWEQKHLGFDEATNGKANSAMSKAARAASEKAAMRVQHEVNLKDPVSREMHLRRIIASYQGPLPQFVLDKLETTGQARTQPSSWQRRRLTHVP